MQGFKKMETAKNGTAMRDDYWITIKIIEKKISQKERK